MKHIWEIYSNALTVPSAEKQVRLQSIWQFILARISVNSWSILVLFSLLSPTVSQHKICRASTGGAINTAFTHTVKCMVSLKGKHVPNCSNKRMLGCLRFKLVYVYALLKGWISASRCLPSVRLPLIKQPKFNKHYYV